MFLKNKKIKIDLPQKISIEIPLPPSRKYHPLYWNDGKDIQFSTNCYAYALNLPFHPITKELFQGCSLRNFSLQPGGLSGYDLDLEDIDASGNLIKDPVFCDRNYKKTNYSDYICAFYVKL
jgi:hypothetical protein